MNIKAFKHILLICVRFFLVVLLVSPWPADNSPLSGSAGVRDLQGRLESFSPGNSRGEVRAGVAEVELTPGAPVPVAGFIGQVMQPYVGVNSRCFAKALTLATPTASVTILAADLLLIDRPLAQAVLGRTGLAADQVFFTATHTHSGLGGWGNHPLERLVAGTYEPEVLDLLTQRLSEVILTSRAQLRPAEVAFVQTPIVGLQRNRIVPDQPTNNLLSAWIFRAKSQKGSSHAAIATLAVFGAHATIGHPNPPRLGGDYPAAFAAALPRLVDAGVILFAAGTVGDSSPVRLPAPNQQQSVNAYGNVLAARLASEWPRADYAVQIDLENLRLDVTLPPTQVPCFLAGLRFSPIFTWWVGRPSSHLHVLRIGPALLIGFPGDLAGHLAARLQSTLPVVATSFNGDYKGYLVAASTFRDYPSYETRWMSFFGAGLGDGLLNLAQRCLDRITPVPEPEARTNLPTDRL